MITVANSGKEKSATDVGICIRPANDLPDKHYNTLLLAKTSRSNRTNSKIAIF